MCLKRSLLGSTWEPALPSPARLLVSAMNFIYLLMCICGVISSGIWTKFWMEGSPPHPQFDTIPSGNWTLIHWVCDTVRAPWKNFGQCLTKSHMWLPFYAVFSLLDIFLRGMQTGPQKDLLKNVHSNLSSNSPRLQTTQSSIHSIIDKQIMSYSWNILIKSTPQLLRWISEILCREQNTTNIRIHMVLVRSCEDQAEAMQKSEVIASLGKQAAGIVWKESEEFGGWCKVLLRFPLGLPCVCKIAELVHLTD